MTFHKHTSITEPTRQLTEIFLTSTILVLCYSACQKSTCMPKESAFRDEKTVLSENLQLVLLITVLRAEHDFPVQLSEEQFLL